MTGRAWTRRKKPLLNSNHPKALQPRRLLQPHLPRRKKKRTKMMGSLLSRIRKRCKESGGLMDEVVDVAVDLEDIATEKMRAANAEEATGETTEADLPAEVPKPFQAGYH